MRRSCIVEALNWIAGPPLAGELPVMAKVRYNMGEQPAVVRELPGGRAHLEPVQAQRAITLGQAAVFYHNDDVGGAER